MRFVVLLLAVIALAAGCTGSTDAAAELTPTAVTETPTAEATSEPTPDPADAIGPNDRIDAAVSQLDADIAAGAGPAETIAYDLLDSAVDADGNVTLTICAWTGDTPFDTVRDSLFRTTVNDDGTVTAAHVTSPVAPGECVNNQLIETAFDFINEFDSYSVDISADPASLKVDERSTELLTASYRSRSDALNAQFEEDGIYFEPSFIAGDVRDDAAIDVLFRRYRFEDLQILELVICRPMNPQYGAYRDGVLVDDGGADENPGLHSIDAYQLIADPQTKLGWRMTGDEGLIWADCLETGDWPGAANMWRPRDDDLEILE